MMTLIEGPYLKDVLEQPLVLQRVCEKLDEIKFDSAVRQNLCSGKIRRVVLTGMGSSLNALYPLHRKLSAAGITSHWIETAELLLGFDNLYASDTLLVAVSQSGESAEIVNLLHRTSEFGAIIGVTNNPDSTLGLASNHTLTLEAGVESTVSCKTYLSTLAVLNWLAAQLTGSGMAIAKDELLQAANEVEIYLASWRGHVAEIIPFLEGVTNIFVTGRGDSLATANTGGLILKESTRLHAEGMSAAAFRHGPLEMAGSDVLVLIFEGDEKLAPLHRRLAEDITRGGGKAALLSEQNSQLAAFRLPVVAESMRPLVEILPIQMLSLALAARDGFEAGRFQRASKITNIA